MTHVSPKAQLYYSLPELTVLKISVVRLTVEYVSVTYFTPITHG